MDTQKVTIGYRRSGEYGNVLQQDVGAVELPAEAVHQLRLQARAAGVPLGHWLLAAVHYCHRRHPRLEAIGAGPPLEDHERDRIPAMLELLRTKVGGLPSHDDDTDRLEAVEPLGGSLSAWFNQAQHFGDTAEVLAAIQAVLERIAFAEGTVWMRAARHVYLGESIATLLKLRAAAEPAAAAVEEITTPAAAG